MKYQTLFDAVLVLAMICGIIHIFSDVFKPNDFRPRGRQLQENENHFDRLYNRT